MWTLVKLGLILSSLDLMTSQLYGLYDYPWLPNTPHHHPFLLKSTSEPALKTNSVSPQGKEVKTVVKNFEFNEEVEDEDEEEQLHREVDGKVLSLNEG